jgi:SAM-dependent methyltransferase
MTKAPPAQPTGYLVKCEVIRGHGADIELRSLLNREQFFDPLGEAEAAGITSATWPIFGLLWPSGQVLAQKMVAFELAGKRILEVGCGLGLASLVVHRRGGDITASDSHPLAALFLADNVLRNAMSPLKFEIGNWSRSNPNLGTFDLIIGSDLLYDRDQPRALSAFIDAHSAATVEVLIVDPDRGNQSGFNRCMGVLGYSHLASRVHALADGSVYKGQIHVYNRTIRGVFGSIGC